MRQFTASQSDGTAAAVKWKVKCAYVVWVLHETMPFCSGMRPPNTKNMTFKISTVIPMSTTQSAAKEVYSPVFESEQEEYWRIAAWGLVKTNELPVLVVMKSYRCGQTFNSRRGDSQATKIRRTKVEEIVPPAREDIVPPEDHLPYSKDNQNKDNGQSEGYYMYKRGQFFK